MYTYQQLQEIVNARLNQQELIRAPEELYEPIDYALSSGGKRLRPVLLLMAANLFDSDIEHLVEPALGIEIFHNFTLLHDDIMDQAQIRRNKATVHRKWNTNIAILSGDAMSIKAYEYLLQYRGSNGARVLEVFSQTALKVCEGQQYDMNFETRQQVSEQEYLRMIGLKTAALIAGSLQMGALMAGSSEEEAGHLYDFGWNLGVAFQLQDDFLDTFGDPKVFGKDIGGDILAGKKTYLVIKALENADEYKRSELEDLMANQGLDPGEKVRSVQQIFRELGVGDLTHIKAEQYYQEALRSMKKIEKDYQEKAPLLQLAERMLKREK